MPKGSPGLDGRRRSGISQRLDKSFYSSRRLTGKDLFEFLKPELNRSQGRQRWLVRSYEIRNVSNDLRCRELPQTWEAHPDRRKALPNSGVFARPCRPGSRAGHSARNCGQILTSATQPEHAVDSRVRTGSGRLATSLLIAPWKIELGEANGYQFKLEPPACRPRACLLQDAIILCPGETTASVRAVGSCRRGC
jgi:hypothetical protein